MPYEERNFSNTGQLITKKLIHWSKTTIPNTYNPNTYGECHPRVDHEESYIYDTNGSGVYSTAKYEYDGDLSQRETPLLRKKVWEYGFVAISSGNGNYYSYLPDPDDLPDPDPTPVPTPVPPTLLRTTETSYLINDGNYSQSVRDIFKNQNMIGLVSTSVVKDAAGTIVSRSKMTYDEINSSPAVGRGNPTSLSVWDSTKGAWDNPNAYITTHAKFDIYGNQYETTDAKGNVTQTEYSATYNYAYPTKVTSAIPDPNSSQNPDALAHGSNSSFVTEMTYDPTTGLPLTTKDANGQITTLEYDPVTLRPKKVTPPAGAGIAETIYHDEPNNYWVKNRTQIDATNWAESITYFDGLGRAYKSEQVDSQGNVFVEKEFDEDGRVKRVTNPFRVNETKQWTTNVYDESSRVKEVILPDGSKVLTDYGISTSGAIGITKQITDQAGKKRKGITNALGRMIRVIEDPTGQNLVTDYTFDTLGNLRKTVQGEQSRYFTYDSLGRLLRAKQPEQEVNTNLALATADAITGHNQWSVAYSYDDNGNITSTTDARGVSVMGYYDRFNRIIYRDYSDSTTDVGFFYDGTGLASVPSYSKGKTTKVTSSVSETRYTSFDNLGRLLTHEQITDGQTYSTAYTYNLSGAIIEETYPSGRVVKNVLNNDGELAILQSKKNANAGFFNYAGNITYNAAGAVEKMRLGNGRWETAAYNSRVQVTQIGLGTTDQAQDLLKLEYSYGTSTQNNGSLREQKITVPTTGTNPGFTATQTYAYDDLNRIQSAAETVSGSQTWKQTFQYDRYGNRRFDAANTTTLLQSNNITNPTIDTATNRFSAGQNYLYDKSGNLTNDASGSQFIYDAENHQKEIKNAQDQTIGLYFYDGDGKRVKKVSSTEETIFVYNASGTLVAEYSTASSQTQQVSYLTQDHLGSPRIITDQTGKVTTRKDYTAFGEETYSQQRTTALNYDDQSETRKGYTGYEKDDESGLEYAQARYYNSQHGRFTSVDPLTASATIKNPQTFNRYSYVLNSPYKFSDPLGLLPQGSRDSSGGCGAENSSCSDDWNPWEWTTEVAESHSDDAGAAPATENTSGGSPAEGEPAATPPDPPPPPPGSSEDDYVTMVVYTGPFIVSADKLAQFGTEADYDAGKPNRKPAYGNGDCPLLAQNLIPNDALGTAKENFAQGNVLYEGSEADRILPLDGGPRYRDIARGTVIFTPNAQGRYDNENSGNHVAIFLRYDVRNGQKGIYVVDQYKGSDGAGIRFIKAGTGRIDFRSNDARAFVVLLRRTEYKVPLFKVKSRH